MNIFSMDRRRWWIEATATYASDGLVFPGSGRSEADMKQTFLYLPVSTADDNHEYELFGFLNYLVRQGASFRGMWDAVHAGSSSMVTGGANATDTNASIVLIPLEKNVYSSTGVRMGTHYLHYASRVLLDASSPLASYDPRGMCTQRSTLEKGSRTAETRLTVPREYATSAWAVTVRSQPNEPRNLSVALNGELRPGLEVGVFRLRGGNRARGVVPVGRLACTFKGSTRARAPMWGLRK